MYVLTWHRAALDRLADIYVVAKVEERERVAAAVAGLNARLRSEPYEVGESRSGGIRVAFVALLVVTFDVDDAGRTVRVTGVRRYGR